MAEIEKRGIFRHLSIVSTCIALLSFCLTSYSALAFDETNCELKQKIILGGLDWDSNTFQNEIVKFVLEKGYGCEVDVIPGTTIPLLTALAKGNLDILMEVWHDNIAAAWSKLEKEKKAQLIGTSFPDAVQGFYVPTYLVKGDATRNITPAAPNLKSVADLPRYKELFKDPERPSKGRFLNCILGWSCENVNTKKLKAYGLEESFVNFRPGTGAALDSAIISSYERGLPFVAYYWGPTWILGKYDLTKLNEPPYDSKIWQQLISSQNPRKATDYPIVKVHIGANTKFVEVAPAIVAFLSKYNLTAKTISEALAYTEADPKRTLHDAAKKFLSDNKDIWRQWVPKPVSDRVIAALEITDVPQQETWSIEIATPINNFVNWLVRNYGDIFDGVARYLRAGIVTIERSLRFIPWWLFVAGMALLSWWISRRIWLPLLVTFCFTIIWSLGLWQLAIQTLALMTIATLICIVFGIPLGILIAESNQTRRIMLPILDATQTMPSFVYLIPALMLFGLGKVPAVFATVIYAIAPLIRLTDHGIRIVDTSIIEASKSLGANRWQLLTGVQLPLALPTIMTGINQTTMLALSMVVIASMIGARGLGEEVLLGVQKLDVGRGFTAGIAIVALAVALDRITQASGKAIAKARR